MNLYLDYVSTNKATNITASFNMVGSRLIQVQLDGTPDIFDRPVPVLDFVFSQRLNKYFTVKGFCKEHAGTRLTRKYTQRLAVTESTMVKAMCGGNIIREAELALGITYNIVLTVQPPNDDQDEYQIVTTCKRFTGSAVLLRVQKRQARTVLLSSFENISKASSSNIRIFNFTDYDLDLTVNNIPTYGLRNKR